MWLGESGAREPDRTRIRIAVIADVHFDDAPPRDSSSCRTTIADVLLLRAVHRLNRMIRPDVTLLLGDLIDKGDISPGKAHLDLLHAIVKQLNEPVIATSWLMATPSSAEITAVATETLALSPSTPE